MDLNKLTGFKYGDDILNTSGNYAGITRTGINTGNDITLHGYPKDWSSNSVQGWICGKCGASNSPLISQCQCNFDYFSRPAFQKTPCAFDGLPPGIYGLVCMCPRCSPQCL